MLQLSVSEFSTYRWSFFHDVVRYAAEGYSSIGVWRAKVDDFGQSEAIDLIHEMKMDVSSLNWVGGFTGSDGRSFVEAVDDAIDAIRLASSLDAACLVVHPGARNGHTRAHANRLFRNALDLLIPVASDYDICLAIEPMLMGDASDWSFLDTFGRSMEIINLYPSNQVGLVLDLFHVGCNASIFEMLSDCLCRLKLVQVADRRKKIESEDPRCSLGHGIIPIKNWIGQLEKLGYRGPLELELRGHDMESVDYEDMLRESQLFLTKTIADVREMANKPTTSFTHSGIKS